MVRRAAFLALAVLLIAPAASAAPGNSERQTYIVVLKPSAGNPGSVASEHSRSNGAEVRHVYRHALRGYAAQMSATAASRVANDGRVAYVEADGEVHATDHATTHQTSATWGLDRIDERARVLDGVYGYNASGAGVRAYIIDTGIRRSHGEFGTRTLSGATAIQDGRGANDCNGHGTHVAGTVGGSTHGVAKNVTLVPVRVLDCNGSGTWSGVIAGVDWVTGQKTANPNIPMVANMSLGGGANDSVDLAVTNSIKAKVSYAVAAGNSGADACNYSPARTPTALTVGATGSTDQAASWSNRGDCLDLFAPGVSITAAWHTSDTATNTISGTSMASPHVAGVAALYLQGDPSATAAKVADEITKTATKDVLGSVDGTSGNGKFKTTLTSPNLLLYSLFGAAPSPPANVAPTANFTSSCTERTCQFNDTSADSDGNIVSWSWNFGDGTTSTAQSPSRTYAEDGTYSVSLTVTDNGGLTNTKNASVTVAASTGGGTDPDPAPPTNIALTVDQSPKIKGTTTNTLGWDDATQVVRVLRNGVQIATTSSGSYTDEIKGGGWWTYQVCYTDGSGCSNEVTVKT